MKTTVRQFRCRDDIWERVEALAVHRGISPDEIVHAALAQMFVQKSKSSESGVRSIRSRPPPSPPSQRSSSTIERSFARSSAIDMTTAELEYSRPLVNMGSKLTQPLYLFCQGKWYTIDKQEFMIGRGQKYCDLAIKDANISRRHCAVVRKNGEYFMTDLGSTNGIEYQGERINNHRIGNGYVYLLCNHELRFSFESPT